MQFDTNYVVALSYIFSASLVVNIEFPYRDMASGIGQKLLLLIPLIILFCKSLARVLRKRQTMVVENFLRLFASTQKCINLLQGAPNTRANTCTYVRRSWYSLNSHLLTIK